MNTETFLTPNRTWKSTLFAMLFKEKRELLSLYNALNHSHHTDEEALEIVTLENAIYMTMKNDLAFLLDNRIHLYEHQSTPNPNMPLRNLFYLSSEYQKMTTSRSLYSTRKLTIPAPHFIVLYNGSVKQPERQVLKLSDLYEIPEKDPMLELKVLMLNINAGNNEHLKESCKTLKEYMLYIERIRKYTDQKKLPLKEAVEKAVTECIHEGILKDFLIKNRAEAIAMSIFEFDAEKEWKMFREAEYQNGVDDGIEQGKRDGIKQGKRLAILEILKDLGTIPPEVDKRIMSEEDTAVLKEMLKAASKADSMEQFQKKLALKQKV